MVHVQSTDISESIDVQEINPFQDVINCKMKPTAVVLLLIVSLAVVLSAPTRTDTRLKLPQEAGASSDTEIQTLIVNLANNLRPAAGSNGGQGFGRPLIGWNKPTGMPANGFAGLQGGVTLQPNALHRPMLANGNQQEHDG